MSGHPKFIKLQEWFWNSFRIDDQAAIVVYVISR